MKMKKRVLQLLVCVSLVAPALFGANVEGAQARKSELSVEKFECSEMKAKRIAIEKAAAQDEESSSAVNKAVGQH